MCVNMCDIAAGEHERHARQAVEALHRQRELLTEQRNPPRKDRWKLARGRPPRLRPGLAQMTTGPGSPRILARFR